MPQMPVSHAQYGEKRRVRMSYRETIYCFRALHGVTELVKFMAKAVTSVQNRDKARQKFSSSRKKVLIAVRLRY